MERLVIIFLVLMTYTNISLGTIGKAVFTPFHGVMALAMGYVVAFQDKRNKNIQLSLVLLIGYIIIVNTVLNSGVRITSVVYSILLSFEYVILFNMMIGVKREVILKALKWVMYTYTANLFLGLVFSSTNLRILETIINVYYSKESGEARPMGFSSEPSYAAFMLSISFLVFNHLRHHKIDRDTRLMTISYLLATVFMKSAYGFIFVAINGLDWFMVIYKRLDMGLKTILVVFGLGLVLSVPILLQSSNSSSIVRLRTVMKLVQDPTIETQKKLQKLQEADGSAYSRIGPTYLLLNLETSLPINIVTGAGAGAAGLFFKDFMAGVLVDDDAEKMDIGVIPAFVFDYGIIGTVFLIIFILTSFYNLPLPFWICFVLVLPNSNINTQLFWYAITLYSYMSIVKTGQLDKSS